MVKCRICGGVHCTRNCPQDPASQHRGTSSSSEDASKPLVGIFFGDVEHFVKDVLDRTLVAALPWLLVVADSVVGVVTGEEDVDETRCLPLPDFVACPFVVVGKVEPEHADLIQRMARLESLRFHGGASIKVFSLTGPSPQSEWSFVFKHVVPQFVSQCQAEEPQWFLPPNQKDGRMPTLRDGIPFPVDRVGVVPVCSTDSGLFIFLVRPPDTHGQVWTTIGGSVRRGRPGDEDRPGDKDVFGTCQREWDEEALAFPFDYALEAGADSCLQHVVWKANGKDWKNWSNCLPAGCAVEKGGVSSKAWLFVQATQKFFQDTCGGVVELVPDGKEVVRKGESRERLKLRHRDGLPFLEQEKGAWFRLDAESGRLFAQFEGAAVRGDLGFTVLRSEGLRGRLFAKFDGRMALPAAPLVTHDVIVSPEGLKNKLEVLKFSFGNLPPEVSTERLLRCVSDALDHPGEFRYQFYAEEVEFYLLCGADPLAVDGLPTGVNSVLQAVLLNDTLNENVAFRSADHLCRARKEKGRSLVAEELELLQRRAQSSTDDLRPQWRHLAEQKPGRRG
mmetsp:Transcript_44027/g.126093  ORF Transcript_44027/g.126093 Transcript_44027/m.126093 type:complete len:561 (+) Transcript_44027:53-1735(+)|eukprot:CAMPEP_0177305000 /NCGR_PEP_ID=MMETSP0368-20130122/6950_1 /TAXON_ID=447022 ORGANISM="Scrippsiella hangoei-like, Strain SHHI-4" /NCGR_SAMPLE_ID=MMETSP0368 /ASSEMBLY_ACC=CAM_ASM_000363 /LENGTH=560 /DNA_ID=CAMNT_0018763619 /DNA_START=39 /DNA_END=1721 /DNA_ORIENTATION=+